MSSSIPISSVKSNSVPLLDVNRGNQALRDQILDRVAQVIDSGRFLHGPEVAELEQQISDLCQTKHAIGCASGSDALLLALMALDIGPGDEVILPSFTFFATASSVSRLGAKIVFADIDPKTYNISPAAIEACITPATRAIIPVHLFGQCAAMDVISKIAEKNSVTVIEDAAQAIGAAYHGRCAGNWGQIGCLSFYPTKNLGGMGDGGMLVCNDDRVAAKLRLLAAHGMQPRYCHQVIGINSRLDTIQAAILLAKIQSLQASTEARRSNAERYSVWFNDSRLSDSIELPFQDRAAHHVWNQYGIRVLDGQRDALKAHLQQRGIGCEIYYPVPMHLQQCFSQLNYPSGSLPITERAAKEILHLPIYPELRIDEQQRVVDEVCQFYRQATYRQAA